jgi:histidinol phosphatase-like enzyme (inositol monophosphatase family)
MSASQTVSHDISTRLELARQIAEEAGRLTLRYFRNPELLVDLKEDRSPVTEADRQAEALLRDRIEAAFPADAILGEEHGEKPGTSGFRWVLDPIDGTKSFVAGVPLYATLVGVLQDEQPVAGVIHAPAADEMVYAAIGGGAWHRCGDEPPRPAKVSEVSRLDGAVLLTTDVAAFTVHRPVDALPAYLELERKVRLARTWGDAYGYLLVATGRAEVMIDPIMNLWDAAALLPVLSEAGGTFTDWRGRATVDAGEGLATNGRLLPEVLAALDAGTR